MSPYAILSALLFYPDAAWRRELPALESAVRALPGSPAADAMRAFIAWAAGSPPLAVERAYVESFDFSKRSGLYLSFYAYGDRRQRGAAMLALKHRYAAAGWALRDGELPDYLPALLEFASLDPAAAGEVLAELRPAIELVRAGLARAESRYGVLLDAVCDLLGSLSDDQREEVERLAREGAPSERVGLEPFAPPEMMPMTCAAASGSPRPVAGGVG
jgi:nitrate reductase delta subunit